MFINLKVFFARLFGNDFQKRWPVGVFPVGGSAESLKLTHSISAAGDEGAWDCRPFVVHHSSTKEDISMQFGVVHRLFLPAQTTNRVESEGVPGNQLVECVMLLTLSASIARRDAC
jgi:hypothetical protein